MNEYLFTKQTHKQQTNTKTNKQNTKTEVICDFILQNEDDSFCINYISS